MAFLQAPEEALVALDPEGVLELGVPDELDEEPPELPDEPSFLEPLSCLAPLSCELLSLFDSDLVSAFASAGPDFFGALP